MTLAQALNDEGASAGFNDGRVWLVDGETDELNRLETPDGDYVILQTNSGPDVWPTSTGGFGVAATFSGFGAPHDGDVKRAEYDGKTWKSV